MNMDALGWPESNRFLGAEVTDRCVPSATGAGT